VAPSAAGDCPACGRNVHQPSEGDPHLTRLQIRENDVLPTNCHLCNTPTPRRVRIRKSFVRGSGHSLFAQAFQFLLFVFSRSPRVFSDDDSVTYKLKIFLPECGACGSRKKAGPAYVDYQRGEFTFVVHRNFRDQVLQLNNRAR